MNTTQTELAKVADTSQVGALALISLSPEKYTKEVYQPFNDQLATAIDSVRTVEYDIKTTVGMAVAIKCRALFRDMRVAADKERKSRKEPITKIGKLLESGFDQVEERITPLEELFDADIKGEETRKEAEKAAKIAAERARSDAIKARIDAISSLPLSAVGKSAEEISAMIFSLVNVSLDGYEEFIDAAKDARFEALDQLAKAETAQRNVEFQAEAQRQQLAGEKADREEEAARLAAERLAIEQERAAMAAHAAEQERIAKAERDAAQAELKAQQDKFAAEQAERQRQMDEQAAELAELRDAAYARDAAQAELTRQQEEADAKRVEEIHAADEALAVTYPTLTTERAGLSAVLLDPAPSYARPTGTMISRPTDAELAGAVAKHFEVDINVAAEWLREFEGAVAA
jgi:hypothetical protein